MEVPEAARPDVPDVLSRARPLQREVAVTCVVRDVALEETNLCCRWASVRASPRQNVARPLPQDELTVSPKTSNVMFPLARHRFAGVPLLER